MSQHEVEADRALIESLGGPTRVARLLSYPERGGAQRVQNWLTRGIPSHVKVNRPDLFMRKSEGMVPGVPASTTGDQPAGQEA